MKVQSNEVEPNKERLKKVDFGRSHHFQGSASLWSRKRYRNKVVLLQDEWRLHETKQERDHSKHCCDFSTSSIQMM